MGSGCCERTAVETVLRRQLSKRTQQQKSLVEKWGKVKDRDFPLFCYELRAEASDPSKGPK